MGKKWLKDGKKLGSISVVCTLWLWYIHDDFELGAVQVDGIYSQQHILTHKLSVLSHKVGEDWVGASLGKSICFAIYGVKSKQTFQTSKTLTMMSWLEVRYALQFLPVRCHLLPLCIHPLYSTCYVMSHVISSACTHTQTQRKCLCAIVLFHTSSADCF